jgi:hypothetical protein
MKNNKTIFALYNTQPVITDDRKIHEIKILLACCHSMNIYGKFFMRNKKPHRHKRESKNPPKFNNFHKRSAAIFCT